MTGRVGTAQRAGYSDFQLRSNFRRETQSPRNSVGERARTRNAVSLNLPKCRRNRQERKLTPPICDGESSTRG